jgi:hypothetical protein
MGDGPFYKGEIPLFEKEGLGEILEVNSIYAIMQGASPERTAQRLY